MTRKKKKTSKKGKNLPVNVLEKRLIDLFSKQVTSRFDAKTIIRKLKLSNSKDSVQHCLDKLVEKGKIEPTSRGKYKWNKTAAQRKKPLNKNAKLASGRVDLTRSGSAYIVCEELEDNDIFVPAHKLMGALDGDLVEVAWYMSRKGKAEGAVVQVLERKADHFIGTLSLSPKFAFVIPDNLNMQTDIFIPLKNIPKEAEDGAKVVVQITKWHTDNKQNPEGKITTYLGTEGGNDIEMKSILIQKGFNLTFPPDVLKENAAIDPQITASEIAKRRDMRAITTFTIDPETAKDFDDALSIEWLENGNYEIGVHIADVGHYVKAGSALDKEAARRTTSVYLVDRVLPMLPEKLSNGVCSLRPHEEKLTFSAVFELDKQGSIINEWFGKTVIYSDRRFTYEEAQERIETGEGDFVKEIQLLNRLAYKLRHKRFKTGAINFESPEVRFKLDEEGAPIDVYLKSRKDAHMLVEDFMLLANKQVGALMHGLHEKLGFVWPMVYRIHDEPDMERVSNFADFAGQLGYKLNIEAPDQIKTAFGKMLKDAAGKPEADILQQLAIRTMAKAVYSIDNIGHYGLGFATYSHFTSPIRRYADVLGHRILLDYLNDTNKRMNPQKLEELCKHISRKERDAMEAERESVKYKQAEFLETHLGEIFEGTISGITDHGIYATIKDNFCEGMIRYDKMFDDFDPNEHHFQIKSPSMEYKMGDSIWVRVLGANKFKRQIDLELLDPEDSDNEPPVRVHQHSKKEAVQSKTVPPKTVEQTTKTSNSSSTKNRHYETLLSQIHQAFQKSHIKTIAKQKNATWNYELSPSALVDDAVLWLHFNPIAQANKDYKAQKLLAPQAFKAQGNTKTFFKTYFPEQKVAQGYLSPFRSMDNKQLSDKDLALSLPIFTTFIHLLQPQKIVSFSLPLFNALQQQGLLSEVEAEEMIEKKRQITVFKAMLALGDAHIPIYFVPSPSSRLLKVLKTRAWDWALT